MANMCRPCSPSSAGHSDARLRQQHPSDGEGHGVQNAFDFPGFVPAYIRPLFCRGVGPFRWVALSGDPEDIYRTDAKVKELIPDDAHLQLARHGASAIKFQGCRRASAGLASVNATAGLAFNEMVASGELKAPIVIGRDHLDSGSVAARTAKPKRCATAPMRCPIGRFSMRCSTAPAAPHGCRPSRRGRRHRLFAARRHGDRRRRNRRLRAASSGCFGTIQAAASCVMPMRDMKLRSRVPGPTVSICPL